MEHQCSLINVDPGTSSNAKHKYHGKKSCVGKVDIKNENGALVDGNWSPWSTLATPCFEERTGQLVECGGGVQYRYRSCSNPHPRNGGKKCVGDNLDKHPCNLHGCPCKCLFSSF